MVGPVPKAGDTDPRRVNLLDGYKKKRKEKPSLPATDVCRFSVIVPVASDTQSFKNKNLNFLSLIWLIRFFCSDGLINLWIQILRLCRVSLPTFLPVHIFVVLITITATHGGTKPPLIILLRTVGYI